LLRQAAECAEQAYLLIPTIEDDLAAGDHEAALQAAQTAAAIGERFRDPDLLSAALHLQGRAVLRRGSVAPGLGLLDEAIGRRRRAVATHNPV
jgi:hypothetical protein